MKVMTCSPSGHLVAWADQHSVVVYDMRAPDGGELVQELDTDSQVNTLAFSSDGIYLTAGTNKGSVITWQVYPTRRKDKGGILSLSSIWDPYWEVKCHDVLTLPDEDESSHPISAIAFPPSKKVSACIVAVGSYKSRVCVLDVSKTSGRPDAKKFHKAFLPYDAPPKEHEEEAAPAEGEKALEKKDKLFKPYENNAVICIAFNTDLTYIAYGIANGRVLIQQTLTNVGVSTLMFEHHLPWSCAFTQVIPATELKEAKEAQRDAKGRDVLAVCAGSLSVWDIERLEQLGPPIAQLFGYVDQPDPDKQLKDAKTVADQVTRYPHLLFEKSVRHEGRTLMQEAAHQSNFELSKLLIQHDPVCAVVLNSCPTTFKIAATNQQKELVNLLLDTVITETQQKKVGRLKPTQLMALSKALPDLVQLAETETINFMKRLKLDNLDKFVSISSVPNKISTTTLQDQEIGMLLERNSSAYHAAVWKDQSSAGESTALVKAKLVTVPNLANEKILSTFASSNDTQIFNNEVVKAVLACLWQHLAQSDFYKKLTIYCLALVLFFAFSLLLADENINDSAEKLLETPQGMATLILDIPLFLLAVYFFFKELKDLSGGKASTDAEENWTYAGEIRKQVKKLTGDPFLFMQFGGSGLLIATPVLHFFRDTTVREVAAVASVVLLINILRYLRGFQSLGPLIRNVQCILVDIISFMVLLFMIVFGFTNAFNLMFANGAVQEFDGFLNTFLTTFGMMLGAFDLAQFYDSSQRELMNVLFILYMFLVNIVLLNMLIAIMGDTYARVSSNAESEFQCARAKLIVETLQQLSAEEYRVRIADFRWIYALQPVGLDKDEDEVELSTINNTLEGALYELRELKSLMTQKGTQKTTS